MWRIRTSAPELRSFTPASAGPSMHTLYLLRHAKSSWSDSALADHERPLAQRGRRDAKRVAEHLARVGIEPELVLCSPAVRTRQTLDRVRAALGATSTVLLEAELYAASSNALLERIRVLPEEVSSVMLIGHNPGLQDLALARASAGPELARLEVKFPTAGLATLALEKTTWSQLSPGDAVLAAFVVPRQLG
jgi:phosphohistidine phosphatase